MPILLVAPALALVLTLIVGVGRLGWSSLHEYDTFLGLEGAVSTTQYLDVFADPQVAHLKMRVDVPHPKLGSVAYVRNGVRLSDTPTAVNTCSPELGEHNDEILGPLRKARA